MMLYIFARKLSAKNWPLWALIVGFVLTSALGISVSAIALGYGFSKILSIFVGVIITSLLLLGVMFAVIDLRVKYPYKQQ